MDALAEHGLTEADVLARKFDARYVSLMKSLIERTRALFQAGLPLAQTVEPFLRVDLDMFSKGGLAILDAIETSGYNTLQHRPALTKWTQMRLLAGALATRVFSSGANPSVYERAAISAEPDPVIRSVFAFRRGKAIRF